MELCFYLRGDYANVFQFYSVFCSMVRPLGRIVAFETPEVL